MRQHPLTEKSHALGFVYAVWIAKLHSRGTRLRERIYLPDNVVGITGDHEALEHPIGGVAADLLIVTALFRCADKGIRSTFLSSEAVQKLPADVDPLWTRVSETTWSYGL